MSDGVRVAFCTCPEREALRIAHHLVDTGVAACVNILPKITSVYRWQGEICEDRESLLIIKTTSRRVEDMRAAVLAVHSYAVPEILVVDSAEAESHEPYIEWVRAAVSRDGAVPEDPE